MPTRLGDYIEAPPPSKRKKGSRMSDDEIVLQSGRILRGPLSDDEWAQQVESAKKRKDLVSFTVNGEKAEVAKTEAEKPEAEVAKTEGGASARNPAGVVAEMVKGATSSAKPAERPEWLQRAGVQAGSSLTPREQAEKQALEIAREMGLENPSKAVQQATLAIPEQFADPKQQAEENKRVESLNRVALQGEKAATEDAAAISSRASKMVGSPLERIDRVIGGGSFMTPEEQQAAKMALPLAGYLPTSSAASAMQNIGAFAGMPNLEQAGENLQKNAALGLATAMMPPAGPEAAPAAPPAPGAPPEVALPPGMPPVGPGGSAGMSMSGSAPMPSFGYTPAKVDTRAFEQSMKDVAAAQQSVVEQAKADADKYAADVASVQKRNLEVAAMNDAATQEQIAAKQTAEDEYDRLMTEYSGKMAEVERASAQGVDPGRFWANKNAGQRAAAIIAGALFGFTGKGMEWIKHLDALVLEDVRMQESDLARKISGLEKGATGLQMRAQAALASGTRRAELRELGKAQRLKEMDVYLQNLSMTAQSNAVRQNAAEMQVAVQRSLAQTQEKVMQIWQFNTAQINEARRANEASKMDAYRFGVQMSQKSAGDSGRALTGAEATRLRDLKQSILNLRNMEQLVSDSSLAARMQRKAGQLIKTTDAAEYEKLKVEAMKKLAGGALQAHELAIMGPLFGDYGDVVTNPADKVRKERERAEEEFLSSLQIYEMSRRPGVEEWRVDPFVQSLITRPRQEQNAPSSYAVPK